MILRQGVVYSKLVWEIDGWFYVVDFLMNNSKLGNTLIAKYLPQNASTY